MELDIEQQEVIDEFLAEAIRKAKKEERSGIVEMKHHDKRMMYMFNHGEDSPKKLLVEYILHLKSSDPTNPKLALLQTVIPKSRFHTWLLESEYKKLYGEIPINEITWDGHGYYYLSTGFRIDSDDDLYKDERLAYNKKKQQQN